MSIKRLVERVFSQPTAPFREHWVREEVINILEENKVPYCTDRFGNVIAGVRNLNTLKRKKAIAFAAHMDHPGFHIGRKVKSSRTKTIYQATFYGGAPFKKMKGAKIRVHEPMNPKITHIGRISKVNPPKKSSRGRSILLEFDKPQLKLSQEAFGSFAFPGYQFRGTRLSARVCDDLAGVVVALNTVIKTWRQGSIAIFTRAEEVGFVGMWAQLKSKMFSPKVHFVSLEASLNLPGARLGKGPVIRLGDRSTMFDAGMARYMEVCANEIQKKDKSFNFQRRILDGGSCEATALGLHGKIASGISVPLFNYHNDGAHAPGPEVIDYRDLVNCAKLCEKMALNFTNFNRVQKGFVDRLEKNYQNLQPLLRKKIRFASRVSDES